MGTHLLLNLDSNKNGGPIELVLAIGCFWVVYCCILVVML